jgi:hypothetical protein
MGRLTLEVYESIVSANEEYNNINKELLHIENELHKTLTSDQFKLLLQYEQTQAELEFHSCDLVHSQKA